MKCEILFGPEAGTVKHFANNDPTAHTMLKSGLLRLAENEPGDMIKMPNGQVIPKMKPAVQPRWYVGSILVTSACDGFAHNDVGKQVPTIVYEGLNGNERVQWAGRPKDVNKCFGLRSVPDEVLQEYTKAYAAYWKDRQ
jgi:hypothetical protein